MCGNSLVPSYLRLVSFTEQVVLSNEVLRFAKTFNAGWGLR